MRLTFERMTDRRPVETRVERDDGVAFRMHAAALAGAADRWAALAPGATWTVEWLVPAGRRDARRGAR
ncbi:hypothetical protein [Geodermatophilus ruber]|uniref:Uncharacterized protein n=1 Tax=Geodermatophilus ruber TaxID=504800 RepID=A0A1I4LF73_9ACTN|nr:hypothetical protein [Geodermatophilus ruber]SFL89496.1 hypothetical protein SAMN04488085_12149 [Geodermatophilus ruber]